MMWHRRLIVGASVAAVAGFGALGAASTSVSAATIAVPFAYTGSTQTYNVPTDGTVCSLTIDAVGAKGGQAGVAGDPGAGGSVAATVAVSPGDSITIDVGGAGGSTNTGTPGSGGFGGGADGGATLIASRAGAGGGGATTVEINGATALVAGGGGGGGGQVGSGGAAGGNGSAPGSAGSPATSSSGSGAGGGGGTLVSGGAGGVAGGGGATAGTNGALATGGTGGGGDVGSGLSGGGGGGGGGDFGGGGGGGATNSNTGGGGGGGSSFVTAAATGVGAGTVTEDASGNGAAQITPVAGTCPPTLIVQKHVTGQVPTGTTFTVHVECSHIVITDASAQASQTTVNEDLTFDAAGNPVSGNPRVPAALTDTCNVTETANGGATAVSYACADNSTTAPAFCQTTNQVVQFGRTSGETATVTVTNAFPPPVTPAAAVLIAPKFTG